MYLIYVDESGDVGSKADSSRYLALSGFVVHELQWHDTLGSIIDFRRRVRVKYGLKLREEIHANHFIHSPGDLARIAKSMRLRLLRDAIDFQAELPHVSILNVLVDKEGKPAGYDFFQSAWRALIQRFENTISQRNFAGPRNARDVGLLVVDQTEEAKLRASRGRCASTIPCPPWAVPAIGSFPSRPWSKTPFTGTHCTRTSSSPAFRSYLTR